MRSSSTRTAEEQQLQDGSLRTLRRSIIISPPRPGKKRALSYIPKTSTLAGKLDSAENKSSVRASLFHFLDNDEEGDEDDNIKNHILPTSKVKLLKDDLLFRTSQHTTISKSKATKARAKVKAKTKVAKKKQGGNTIYCVDKEAVKSTASTTLVGRDKKDQSSSHHSSKSTCTGGSKTKKTKDTSDRSERKKDKDKDKDKDKGKKKSKTRTASQRRGSMGTLGTMTTASTSASTLVPTSQQQPLLLDESVVVPSSPPSSKTLRSGDKNKPQKSPKKKKKAKEVSPKKSKTKAFLKASASLLDQESPFSPTSVSSSSSSSSRPQSTIPLLETSTSTEDRAKAARQFLGKSLHQPPPPFLLVENNHGNDGDDEVVLASNSDDAESFKRPPLYSRLSGTSFHSIESEQRRKTSREKLADISFELERKAMHEQRLSSASSHGDDNDKSSPLPSSPRRMKKGSRLAKLKKVQQQQQQQQQQVSETTANVSREDRRLAAQNQLEGISIKLESSTRRQQKQQGDGDGDGDDSSLGGNVAAIVSEKESSESQSSTLVDQVPEGSLKILQVFESSRHFLSAQMVSSLAAASEKQWPKGSSRRSANPNVSSKPSRHSSVSSSVGSSKSKKTASHRLLSESLHPKADLQSFLKHLSVLNDLKELADGTPVVEESATEFVRHAPPHAKHSPFHQMFRLKCTLLNILNEDSPEEAELKRQALVKQFDLETSDLDFVLEHVELCEQANTEIRWDLVRTIFFPEGDDLMKYSGQHHQHSHHTGRNFGGYESLPLLDFHTSMMVGAPRQTKCWNSAVDFSTHWNSSMDLSALGQSHGSLQHHPENGYDDDENNDAYLSPREELQEEILQFYEDAEDTMSELPPNERQIRRQILMQLLQATSDDEAHLTTLSLGDVAEIVRHVRICDETDTQVEWDMIRDIVFPLGTVDDPQPPETNRSEHDEETKHHDLEDSFHHSFSLVENRDPYGVMEDLLFIERANASLQDFFGLSEQEVDIILDHINTCQESVEPIRWDLIGEVLFPGDPVRQGLLSDRMLDNEEGEAAAPANEAVEQRKRAMLSLSNHS